MVSEAKIVLILKFPRELVNKGYLYLYFKKDESFF